jgi:hypothetical protein
MRRYLSADINYKMMVKHESIDVLKRHLKCIQAVKPFWLVTIVIGKRVK